MRKHVILIQMLRAVAAMAYIRPTLDDSPWQRKGKRKGRRAR